jgi:hypothetical protein
MIPTKSNLATVSVHTRGPYYGGKDFRFSHHEKFGPLDENQDVNDDKAINAVRYLKKALNSKNRKNRLAQE